MPGLELLSVNDRPSAYDNADCLLGAGYNWTIILPAELSAAAVLINYWNQTVNNAAWISIFLVVVIIINMFGAGMFQLPTNFVVIIDS